MKLVAVYTHPENGMKSDQMRAEALKQGSIYPITNIEVHNYRTNIFLKGFEHSFNSVLFDIYKLDYFDVRDMWIERW